MGGSAKQLKPHNNLPGMNGNSLNPLKVSPGPGIPAPMNMPGMPGGSFNPMNQLRQLPGMGGGGGGGGGMEPQDQAAQMNAQGTMLAGMQNARGQMPPEWQQMAAMQGAAGGPMNNAAAAQREVTPDMLQAMQGQQQSADKMQRLGPAQMPIQQMLGGMGSAPAGGSPDMAAWMQRMGGQQAPAAAPPPVDPNRQIAQNLGGPQSLAGTAAANEYGGTMGGGGGKKAMQKMLNPQQAQRMAGMLGGGAAKAGGRVR